ncbi:uncharacterized protein LOC124361554 [Homalodisca vitripennis]|uniref:uncharacterized protein LOC124361554 n=1 Tax=Homalodisca vitripennis TaxID=197043 RepID=UPI001EEB68B1|nr:uncharacterized protein LOC124361554 [Homalodisca vitripennis]
MSRTDIDTLSAENMPWRCEPCGTTRRQSMRLESQATDGTLTIQDIMRVLNDIRTDQANFVKDLNTSYESLQEQLTANTEAINKQVEKVNGCMEKFEAVIEENLILKKRVEDLEVRLEEAEQYSRRNTIEIHGLPFPQNKTETQEEVIELVKKVGEGLGTNIDESMIDACHRLSRRPMGDRPPPVVVKFVRRIDKDRVMEKRRQKREFSTRHMGLAMDTPVYLNEAMSPARRRLFALAREAKKTNNYQFLWSRNGKIFMRKKTGDSVVLVTCQDDLNKLK